MKRNVAVVTRIAAPVHLAWFAVVCVIVAVAMVYGYVAGTHTEVARGRVLAPLHAAMEKHDLAAIAEVIPTVLQAAKNDKEVLLWAVAVTNAPSLTTEHQEAVLAYCHANGPFLAELVHRVFAIGGPQCR